VTPLQPHPQRWQALAELVGVSPNADSVKSDHTGRELRFSIFSGQDTTRGEVPKTATAIAPTIWSIIRTSSGNRRRMGSCTMVQKVDTARGGSLAGSPVHILPLFINAFFATGWQ
jgi:hypothetical protein